MMKFASSVSCLLCLFFTLLQAADARDPHAFRVLPAEGKAVDAGHALKNYLLKQAKRQFDARRKIVSRINTVEQLQQYRKDVRRKLLQINGPFPDKTPLRARVLGKIDCQGYTIEKVIYESRPRHHVTANLYLPKKRRGPIPAVLVPCGHSRKGKAYPSYQSICISLAQNGMAAFIYDPTGQAERRQVLDASGNPLIGPACEHTAGGVGALLVGLGAANYMIWDGIRGDEVSLGYGTDPETGHAHSTGQNGTLFKIEELILSREEEVPLPGLLMTPLADTPKNVRPCCTFPTEASRTT